MISGIRMLPLAAILLACCAQYTVSAQVGLPCDQQATKETVRLYANLKKLPAKGYLVGHQDDLAYGVQWKYTNGGSDVKAVTGDYPGLYGWDLGHLELGSTVNIDSVPFDTMRGFIRQGYSRGGVITISWHGTNPMTGKSAWDAAPGSVAAILPGGASHAVFVAQLQKVAAFLRSLTDRQGRPIPVIFRPFHELSGHWFWWGARTSTPEEFKTLFRFTVDYLRQTEKLHHLLICFNTGTEFSSEEEFLERYPGDDYADILSFDTYQHGGATHDSAFAKSLSEHLSVVEAAARKKNKIPAIGELGYNTIPYSSWFTHTLTGALKGHQLAYLLFWRNAGFKRHEQVMEYYVPYPGHGAAADFTGYYQLPETFFEKDAAKAKLYR